jgi:excisionase family DNA binding protein
MTNNALLPELLRKENLTTLRSGLIALEGSLAALNVPAPANIKDLKSLLTEQIAVLDATEDESMTTREVAQLLNCTNRNVLKLGKKGKIKLIKRGSRKRGDSNLYSSASVLEYLEDLQECEDK